MTDSEVKYLCDALGKSEKDIISDFSKICDARHRMLFKSRVELGLQLGDLVFDKKNREVGFVVGEINPYSQTRPGKQVFFGECLQNGKVKDPTVLVVTLYTPEEEKSSKIIDPFEFSDVLQSSKDTESRFRVRYTKRNDLKVIQLPEEQSEKSDLEIFCESQCILDCGSDCVFWKYKKHK